ncbi:MAG: type II secretion system protein GspG [Verrucomicrobiales bacterium]
MAVETRILSTIGILAVIAWISWGVHQCADYKGHDRLRSGETRYRVQKVGNAIKAYYAEFSQFPSGDSAAIVRQILGENPRGIRMLYLSRHESDAQGFPIDAYGRPFRIKISGNAIEVRSAGKDGEFETDDDVLDVSER